MPWRSATDGINADAPGANCHMSSVAICAPLTVGYELAHRCVPRPQPHHRHPGDPLGGHDMCGGKCSVSPVM